MKDSRRSFIKKSTALASALTAGGWAAARPRAKSSQNANFPGLPAAAETRGFVRDAGLQLSEAYFDVLKQH